MALRKMAFLLPILAAELDGKKFRIWTVTDGWNSVTIDKDDATYPFLRLYHWADGLNSTNPRLDEMQGAGQLLGTLGGLALAAVASATAIKSSYHNSDHSALDGNMGLNGLGVGQQWALDVGTTVTTAGDVVDATLFGLRALGGAGGGGVAANLGVYISGASTPWWLTADYQAPRLWMPRHFVSADRYPTTEEVTVAMPRVNPENSVIDWIGTLEGRFCQFEAIEAALLHKFASEDSDYSARVLAETTQAIVVNDPNVYLQQWHQHLLDTRSATDDTPAEVVVLLDWVNGRASSGGTIDTWQAGAFEAWVMVDLNDLTSYQSWLTRRQASPLLEDVRVRGFKVTFTFA